MTRDTTIFIANLYIKQQLHQTPATYEVLRCPEDDVRSKFFEFSTNEGNRIEVCIRPRDGIISSTSRSEDGTISTHSVTFRKVPLGHVPQSPTRRSFQMSPRPTAGMFIR